MAHEIHTRPSRLAGIAALALAAATISCTPTPDPDDEGHATFAREAIKVLLGRPAHGVDEVEAVADISQLLGRKVAARMLMEDAEFTEHWSNVMIDLLQVRRETVAGLGAQERACWAEASPADPGTGIAEWVRDHGPLDGGAGKPTGWNMAALIRSSVELDNLSPVHRANLFPMSMRLIGAANRRQQLATLFQQSYVSRDVACLRCHNPTYSASNKTDGMGDIVWQRMWTVPGHPEKALYGNYYDAAAVMSRLNPIFRGDVRRPADAPGGGIMPWGMDESCATDENFGGTPTHVGFRTLGAGFPSQPTAGFGSLDGATNPRLSIWELEQALEAGISSLEDGYERFPASSPVLPPDEQSYCEVVEVFSGKCTGCHAGATPAAGMDLASSDPAGELINVSTESGSSVHPFRVIPGDPSMSELWRRLDTDSMPPGGGLPPADKTTIQSWIAANAPATPSSDDCNTSPIPDVDPDEAFAYLVASHLVDGIWMTVMGERLTIDHGFARNKDQLHMLWNLTEYTFLKEDWSLKAVLAKILASDWFARRAPVISQQNTAYELQPIVDPWIEADPTEVTDPAPHQEMNGQGELVARMRVNSLVRRISASLGWQAPDPYPGADYPRRLAESLGQGYSPETPGFDGINFQSLLALEDEIGLCERSGHAAGPEDYIDALVDAVVGFNTDNPAAPLTVGEAWAALKDRMIQDPTIETVTPSGLSGEPDPKTEQTALVAFVNAELAIAGTPLTLSSSTATLTEAELDTALRSACSVLMKTPQFLLAHLTPRGYSDNDMPDPPRLVACMPGEPCGYAQVCNHWRGRLSGMGHTVACGDRTVRKATRFIFPGYFGTIELARQVELGRFALDGRIANRELIAQTDERAITVEQRLVKPPQGSAEAMPGRAVAGPRVTGQPRPAIRVERSAEGDVIVTVPEGTELGDILPGLATELLQLPGERSLIIELDKAGAKDLTTTPKPYAADNRARGREAGVLAIDRPLPHERPLDLDSAVRYDALASLVIERAEGQSVPMDRVRQRVETLCLDGMCGFVRRSPRHLERCLEEPRSRSCENLRPTCDPRTGNSPFSCADLPADYTDTGVLAVWAEGAEVQLAEAARLLREGARRWTPLRGGERLEAGDLIYLPIQGRIRIRNEDVVFGDEHAEEAAKSGVAGHMLSVIGRSTPHGLTAADKPGALSPAAVAAGSETMRFQSGPLVGEQLERSIGYGARPVSRPELTLEEIREINSNYEALHRGLFEEDAAGDQPQQVPTQQRRGRDSAN